LTGKRRSLIANPGCCLYRAISRDIDDQCVWSTGADMRKPAHGPEPRKIHARFVQGVNWLPTSVWPTSVQYGPCELVHALDHVLRVQRTLLARVVQRELLAPLVDHVQPRFGARLGAGLAGGHDAGERSSRHRLSASTIAADLGGSMST
jgi:hypothetical protein